MKAARILILEDDPFAASALRLALSDAHDVRCFSEGDSAEKYLTTRPADLVILDLHLGERSGLDWLRRWRKKFPTPQYMFCSGEKNIEAAISCFREGARDFVTKPFSKDRLLASVSALLPTVAPAQAETFLGESPAAVELRRRLVALRVATDINVVLLGETGTGKEVAARFLNEGTGRPLVAFSACAVHAGIAEAEFFGVEAGAFTGALARPGYLERADGGDLFIDEIGDIPLSIQAKLLRALQEKVVCRVGGHRERHARSRVVSATNRSLGALVAAGEFREDFFYRIAEEILEIPPLRERREDIRVFADHFLEKFSPGEARAFSDRARRQMNEHAWPGNVRQLAAAVKRAARLSPGKIIDVVPTEMPLPPPHPPANLKAGVLSAEREKILSALRGENSSLGETAKRLGISRTTLYRKMKKAGISPGPSQD